MSGGPAPLAGRPTLLQQAAAQGNVTLLSMLLNEEGLDINYSCEDGHSALYSAAKNGHTGKDGEIDLSSNTSCAGCPKWPPEILLPQLCRGIRDQAHP